MLSGLPDTAEPAAQRDEAEQVAAAASRLTGARPGATRESLVDLRDWDKKEVPGDIRHTRRSSGRHHWFRDQARYQKESNNSEQVFIHRTRYFEVLRVGKMVQRAKNPGHRIYVFGWPYCLRSA